MKYRYLGSRGIFVGKKHYHSGDIIEAKKEDLPDESFEEVKATIPEKERLTTEMSELKNKLKKFQDKVKREIELKEKEIEDLKKSLTNNILETKLTEIKKVYNELFERKKVKEVHSDGNNRHIKR